jgi:hypothetical protein
MENVISAKTAKALKELGYPGCFGQKYIIVHKYTQTQTP